MPREKNERMKYICAHAQYFVVVRTTYDSLADGEENFVSRLLRQAANRSKLVQCELLALSRLFHIRGVLLKDT